MNKKGLEIGTLAIVSIILGLLVIFVGYNILRPTASEAAIIASTQILKARDATCKFDTERLEVVKPENDIDNDGRHDGCDRCVCRDKKCSNADDNDSDRDGMPDGCEKSKDIKDGTKISCKFTETEDGRCVGS